MQQPDLPDIFLTPEEERFAALVAPYFRCFETGLDWWKEQAEPKPQWLIHEIVESILQVYKVIAASPYGHPPAKEAEPLTMCIALVLSQALYIELWPSIARALTQNQLAVWRREIEGWLLRYGNEETQTAVEAPYYQKMAYADYLRTDHWKALRLRKLHSTDYRCEVCNVAGTMHVHHRTYKRRGHERLEDLTVLCSLCHQLFHEHGKLVPPPEDT